MQTNVYKALTIKRKQRFRDKTDKNKHWTIVWKKDKSITKIEEYKALKRYLQSFIINSDSKYQISITVKCKSICHIVQLLKPKRFVERVV